MIPKPALPSVKLMRKFKIVQQAALCELERHIKHFSAVRATLLCTLFANKTTVPKAEAKKKKKKSDVVKCLLASMPGIRMYACARLSSNIQPSLLVENKCVSQPPCQI